MAYERIIVVGKSGAGKTTLARELAERLDIPHVELDAINWQPNWVSLPKHEMRERVKVALPAEGQWVADGAYIKSAGDVVWGRADTLIWLDYPLILTLLRLMKRTIGRIVKQKELWNGNRESVWNHLNLFEINDNLFVWTIRMHFQQRRDFPIRLRQSEYSHLRVLRFRSPKETELWLQGLPGAEELVTGTSRAK